MPLATLNSNRLQLLCEAYLEGLASNSAQQKLREEYDADAGIST